MANKRIPLAVHTAPLDYPGPDRLDISRTPPFAPRVTVGSWNDLVNSYMRQLRIVYRTQPGQFEALLQAPRVVLCCSRPGPEATYRAILATVLGRLGARNYGEIQTWDSTPEDGPF